MLSATLDKVWNALSFKSESRSRKRQLSCRDTSDDEDDDPEIDILVTNPKRARVGPNYSVSDSATVSPWHSSLSGGVAYWVSKSKRRFEESYFYKKMMPLHSRPPSNSQQNFDEVIVIDDDDDPVPEVVVIPDDSSSGQNCHRSQSLVRPPLSRKSITGPREKLRGTSGKMQAPLMKKSINGQHVTRRSESRNSSTECTPIFDRVFSKNSRPLNSNRVHDLTGQENRMQGFHSSTISQSVRLHEREAYQQLLKRYYTTVATPVSDPPSSSPIVSEGASRLNSKAINGLGVRNKSPVLKQKLDNTFKEDLRGRLQRNAGNADCIQIVNPVPESTAEVRWLCTTNKSPDIKVIERKIPPAVKSKILTRKGHAKDIEVVTISPTKSRCCKLLTNQMYESPYLKETWLANLTSKYQSKDELTRKQIDEEKAKIKKLEDKREIELRSKLRDQLRLDEIPPLIEEEEEVQEVEKLIELTPEMVKKVKAALHPTPPNEVLIEAFRLRITRRDMETLSRDNWLNDEVINFYFTLLSERGKLDNYPSVYTCNTFFYPKLISSGHSSLKRWTRKIDIFAHDLMLVPVHLGVHWCLSVVDFRNKKIQYYDSMGGKNQQCLTALRGYLEAERLEKKKEKLDTSDWTLEIVKNKPNQLNGSDCGMFTCKYAEYISRNAKITFTQEDMPYFRQRMVYEILTAKLL